MSVRKTESRLPASAVAADLGQAVVAADGRSALVSHISSPVVAGRENIYVVFVTDAGLAGSVQTFEWSFAENGGAPNVQSSDDGEIAYTPNAPGQLSVRVRVLGSGNSEQAVLSLEQDSVAPNVELEGIITDARNETGPSASNPEVARELINDHNAYYQNVTARNPEPGDAFQRFVFSMVYDGVTQRTATRRKQHFDELAHSLNDSAPDFAASIAEDVGVCGVRLALLAMVMGELDWTELPEAQPQRASGDEELRERLAQLDQNTLIDLFNLVRFPKSNIVQCARIIEALRDRYFPGTNFNDVLTGMSGTRAHWIVRHYREGPLVRT